MGAMNRGLGRAVEGIGSAAENLSEVFVPNATRAMELSAEIHGATLETAAAEFEYGGTGWFDRVINGLNRLPRPLLALGTLGLFTYAMADPFAFSERMVGLQNVPEPLWWLLGAIVSFYFGARELHYARSPLSGRRGQIRPTRGRRRGSGGLFGRPNRRQNQLPYPVDNPALEDWRGRNIAEDMSAG